VHAGSFQNTCSELRYVPPSGTPAASGLGPPASMEVLVSGAPAPASETLVSSLVEASLPGPAPPPPPPASGVDPSGAPAAGLEPLEPQLQSATAHTTHGRAANTRATR